ncbi:MAG TPA: hypothetical protein VHC18_22885 [Amycolatopsis sp.]|nr:hypothetical protein [Amycolatopsis sp.]
MVLAISFIEAPLKFRAPGITIPLGLGIGRLVFRALNGVEVVLALTVLVTVVAGGASTAVLAPAVVVAVILAVQLGVIRPSLNRRSNLVLAGENLPRSRAHMYYVACESIKVLVLLALGVAALAGGS